MLIIRKLVWDSWNVEHIKKHSLGILEVEKVLQDPNLVSKRAHSGRIMLLGRSGKRLLSIILAFEEQGFYYLVTARDMDKKERELYRKNHEKIKNHTKI